MILPISLNKYLQKWISLISCFETDFTKSFLISVVGLGLTTVVSRLMLFRNFVLVVWKELFSQFFEDGVFVLFGGKLNLEKSWFLGEVMLVLSCLRFWLMMLLGFIYIRMFEELGLKLNFFS